MMELKERIIALCNQSGLTIEEVFFVLKDAYRDAEDAFLEYKAKKAKMAAQEEDKDLDEDEDEEKTDNTKE